MGCGDLGVAEALREMFEDLELAGSELTEPGVAAVLGWLARRVGEQVGCDRVEQSSGDAG
jgi:hypothetical protein